MDMRRNMFFIIISMLVDEEKEWDSYKMKVVIKKDGMYLLKKLIKKELITKKEIVSLKMR